MPRSPSRPWLLLAVIGLVGLLSTLSWDWLDGRAGSWIMVGAALAALATFGLTRRTGR